MAKRFAYTLNAPLKRKTFGKRETGRTLSYVVVYLDDALQQKLIKPGASRPRIEGELNGHPVALALQPARGSNHYAMIGPKLLAASGALIGDEVALRFDVVDANEVKVPRELAEALAAEPAIRKKWDALTPGKRRGWSCYVDRPKGRETRVAKAHEVVDRVRRNLLGQRDRWP